MLEIKLEYRLTKYICVTNKLAPFAHLRMPVLFDMRGTIIGCNKVFSFFDFAKYMRTVHGAVRSNSEAKQELQYVMAESALPHVSALLF
jgi:hypothetical protein